jgi:hypothetical protein
MLEGHMREYKIYVLDRLEHIVLGYDFTGPDDASALEECQKHSDKTALEIWEGPRLVARVAQSAKAVAG